MVFQDLAGTRAIAAIAGQVFQAIQALGRQAGRAIQGRQVLAAGQAKLGRQGLQVGRASQALAVIAGQGFQGTRALAGQACLAGRAIQGRKGRQVIAGRQAGLVSAVRWGRQGRQVGLASAGSVAIAGQEFQGTRDLAGTQVSKVHRSISKAQWPPQLPCHPLETIPMMHTLFHPMAICTFGVERPGTMLAK